MIAISAVPAKNDDTKAKQNILALGVDELFMATDDALETADSYATAQVLKNIVETKVPDYDVIICGDGSADLYAGQVNIQLAAALGVPTINEVTSLTAEGDKLVVERTLDEEVEEIEVPLPAVVSVSVLAQPANTENIRAATSIRASNLLFFMVSYSLLNILIFFD